MADLNLSYPDRGCESSTFQKLRLPMEFSCCLHISGRKGEKEKLSRMSIKRAEVRESRDGSGGAMFHRVLRGPEF